MKNELASTWKEAVVAYFEALSYMDIWIWYVENKNRDCYGLDAAFERGTSHVKSV
jgi:hypothetical protein